MATRRTPKKRKDQHLPGFDAYGNDVSYSKIYQETPSRAAATTRGYGNFTCTVCSRKFGRKLLLSNHKKFVHGIYYAFAERGKRVKFVRLPGDDDDAMPGDENPERAGDSENTNSARMPGNVAKVSEIATLVTTDADPEIPETMNPEILDIMAKKCGIPSDSNIMHKSYVRTEGEKGTDVKQNEFNGVLSDADLTSFEGYFYANRFGESQGVS